MIKRSDIEIMAPVGSWESLHAAVQAKADSVYFGIDKLNMRSRSSVNFGFEDLKKITAFAQQNNLRTYLTLNTTLYTGELSRMHEIIDAAAENNISAVIVSDQAAISYAHQKGLEVHLSTQLSISNIDTVKFYASYADVMVLARELNLDQVKEISDQITRQKITGPSGNPVIIEIFAHGALCMSVSGKCYLSLHEYNHSANRGACLQNCRRGYTVHDKESGSELNIENQYIMSPKDLLTIHFLNKITEAGVRVLKIEGRARPPEYVKTVVECYHEAILSLEEGTYSIEKIEEWKTRLSRVFNRGFWNGYYLGQRLGEWSNVYGSKAKRKKVYVGKGMNYFSNLGVAEFLCETGSLNTGDEILISGPSTGVVELKLDEIRVNMEKTDEVSKGQRFSIKVPATIRRSDKLYKLTILQDNSLQ